MNDQQRKKYELIRDKLNDEHWAELEHIHVLDILNRAKKHQRKKIKGVEYNIAYYTDDDGTEMRFILGYGCWTTAPAERPLKECLPVRE